ncbi:hypothetical protein C8J57DRAFT_1263465 [Mycena rebaudengoi]|nr:hypothetical protein C8J57DRAFT_1263465 [Mycena rebaudengoi]
MRPESGVLASYSHGAITHTNKYFMPLALMPHVARSKLQNAGKERWERDDAKKAAVRSDSSSGSEEELGYKLEEDMTTYGRKCGRQRSMPNSPNSSDFFEYFCGAMVYGSMLTFCGFYLIHKVPKLTEKGTSWSFVVFATPCFWTQFLVDSSTAPTYLSHALSLSGRLGLVVRLDLPYAPSDVVPRPPFREENLPAVINTLQPLWLDSNTALRRAQFMQLSAELDKGFRKTVEERSSLEATRDAVEIAPRMTETYEICRHWLVCIHAMAIVLYFLFMQSKPDGY